MKFKIAFPKSKLKILYIIIIIVIISVLLLELLAPFLYRQINKKPFQKKELQKRLFHSKQINETISPLEGRLPGWVTNNDLHPYIGFTYRRSIKNRYGFIDLNPLLKRSPGKINICIMGGSFAESLYIESKQELKESLKKSSYFADKDIKITALAIGGFKQPQQLFALTYLLFLGAQYDIVINLDGFNEIALPFSENIPFQTAAYYPRAWFLYTTKSLDIKSTLQMAKIYKLREKKEKLRRFFSTSPMYHSNYLLFLWDILDKRYENKIRLENNTLGELFSKTGHQSFDSNVSLYKNNKNKLFEDLVYYWKSSSIQINYLSKPNKFIYFHFLQPNQYYTGSKILSEAEKIHAYTNEPYKYKEAVLAGYPLLVKEGENLKKENINFYDLTMIFKNDNRTLYIDKCCHLNKLGYNCVSKEIARAIIQYFVKNR
jgi:hypothetical protein